MSWITKDGRTYYGIEMTKEESIELEIRINHFNTCNFQMELAKGEFERAKKYLDDYLAELQKPSRKRVRKSTKKVVSSEDPSHGQAL
jgi:hypothetical protein